MCEWLGAYLCTQVAVGILLIYFTFFRIHHILKCQGFILFSSSYRYRWQKFWNYFNSYKPLCRFASPIDILTTSCICIYAYMHVCHSAMYEKVIYHICFYALRQRYGKVEAFLRSFVLIMSTTGPIAHSIVRIGFQRNCTHLKVEQNFDAFDRSFST